MVDRVEAVCDRPRAFGRWPKMNLDLSRISSKTSRRAIPPIIKGRFGLWLAGLFVEAWVRVRGNTPQVGTGSSRTVSGAAAFLLATSAGLNHLPEIADAVEPYTPRGCPFQAWSVGEFLRLDRVVLRMLDHNWIAPDAQLCSASQFRVRRSVVSN